MKDPIKQFKVIGYLEGMSFLLLLGLAMPLKYGLGMDMAVTIVGSAHGALFVLYIAAIFYMMVRVRWSLFTALLAFVASIVPFGPFIFDAKILKQQETTV